MYYLFFLIFLCGCVPIPKENHPSQFFAAPSLETAIEKGKADHIIMEGSSPCNWWKIFENEQLSCLIERGLSNNPTLQEAIVKIKFAKNEAKIKRSALFPTVWLDGEANAQHLAKNGFFRTYASSIPPNVTEYTLDLDFSYEFDFWGKRRNLYYAALGKIQASKAEKKQADLMISSSIASLYFKLQSAFKQLYLLNNQQEIARTLVEMRQRRQQHALDSTNQVVNAQKLFLMLQQQILIAKQNIDLLKHQLFILMGEGPDQNIDFPPISLDTVVKVPIPSFLPSDLLANRPDLIAQIWRVEAAAYEIGAAKADFYPNVNLTGFVGLDTVFISKLFSKDSVATTVTPAFHLPIFTAGRIKANLEEKRADLDKEIQIYNQMLLAAAKEVADQLVNLRTADQNIALQETIIGNRFESQYLTNLQMKHALADSLGVLESNIDVLEQEKIKIEIQYQYYLAIIELMKALGGSYQAACCTPISSEGI